MQIDIILSNARIYDINKVDIVIAEKFSLIPDDTTKDIRLFADNDPVLDIVQNKTSIDVVASDIGMSTILLMNPSMQVEKTLYINVVASLTPATNLNISAEPPVLK